MTFRAICGRSLLSPCSSQAAVPGVDSLVDHSRFWRVALPFDVAVAWVGAHPPAGLTASGSGEGGNETVHYRGYAYRAPATAAWQSSELDVSIAPDQDSGSIVRADGLVVWLDPRPVPDALAGPRLRVTLSDACPAGDATMVGVTNPTATGLDAQLVPPGDPTAGLVCEYVGMNGDEFHLRRAVTLSADSAIRVATAVRALPLSHVIGDYRFCPFDKGAASVVVLVYPGRPDVDLWLRRRVRLRRKRAHPHRRMDARVMSLTM